MNFTCWLTLLVVMIGVGTVHAEDLPAFDFSQPPGSRGWVAAHDVSPLQHSPQGLVMPITGSDPYIVGPARDYPAGTPLWLHLRLKADQAGSGQVFYFQDAPSEANSVHFPVQAGVWQEVLVPVPALGPGYHLRFDPPGTGGQTILAWLRFSPRVLLREPAWPRPTASLPAGKTYTLRSGDLTLTHGSGGIGDFQVQVAQHLMAAGLRQPLIGYEAKAGARWLDLNQSARGTRLRKMGRGIELLASWHDPDGGAWEFRQQFTPATTPGAINVETQVTVDHDRTVEFLPLFTLLPGLGSFGTAKGQGLFAGLEYLDGEPGSSAADLIGPESHRQVPDSLKLTFPLMAIQADERYVGLLWDHEPRFSAVFDSPDRLFHSGGHIMGVSFPGSDGANRIEGNLLPYQGEVLPAHKPLMLHATIIGGPGHSVLPAVQRYVQLRGLPPVPDPGMDFQSYAHVAGGGWLDSKIRAGDQFRHAYWPGFEPHAAADAPLLMEWLARQSHDATLAARLQTEATAALTAVPADNVNFASVSHVTYPVAALVYGHVAENAARAEQVARDLLTRFEPDGTVLYRASAGHPDYGKTHFARHANGLTAQVVVSLLEAASVAGNHELIAAAIQHLRALDQYTNSVPRGAQTWEVPLHTPDILASAYLVRAYTRGYELTGDPHFLDQARHWAWTGVPFVYLINPTGQRVGPYSTIAVLGATNWQAPVWMGLPVQWCGLVYSDALYRLARSDATGPWTQLADGITATGIQFSWPATDTERQGLLPDSYHLRAQLPDGPAINPGTVQTNAIRLFHQPALYDFRACRAAGMFVHAPGAITVSQEGPGHLAFTVQGWPGHPYYVLISGLQHMPRLRLNGAPVGLEAPHQYVVDKGQLILRVTGRPVIEINA